MRCSSSTGRANAALMSAITLSDRFVPSNVLCTACSSSSCLLARAAADAVRDRHHDPKDRNRDDIRQHTRKNANTNRCSPVQTLLSKT